ncbi:TonB-dependent receptor [Olivibacter ginsenosidimutans]|uniref:TonB-dependent receptor n=2 Tax=Olivibacter ginsenosidimutans TaxID=1176537 RepID=A0ABP9CC94_9SPHI
MTLNLAVYGQQHLLDKPITLQLHHVTLAEALTAIENQAEVDFSYSSTQLNVSKRVDVQANGQPLRHVLQQLLGEQLKRLLVEGTQITIQSTTAFGTVKGVVKTSDGQSAGYVTVSIKGQRSTQANADGTFTLKNIAVGTYTATASYVGLQTQQQSLTVNADQVTNLAFVLKEDAETLQEVVVNGEKANRYTAKESNNVAKMPLGDLENPQVYVAIPKEVIQDQVIVTYADVLKNMPGVILQLENNSAGGTVTTRGFSAESYLRNGIPGTGGSVSIDPINIESVETIKGPSGTLYGASLISYGGLFNRVTKKPFETFRGEMAYTVGGYGLNRLTADINTPLNQEKTLLFRFNGALHHANTFQDAGFQTYAFFAPSLTYKIDEKTSLNLELEYTKEKANDFYRLFTDGSIATGVHSPKELNIDFNRRFIGDDLATNLTQVNFYADLNHQFSDQWQSITTISTLVGASSGASGYFNLTQGNDSLSRSMTYSNYYKSRDIDVQENIMGDFLLGTMRNRLLIGAELYSTNYRSNSAFTVFDTINVADPGKAYSALTMPALIDRVKNLPFSIGSSTQNTYSAYVQDALNITDKLIALASIRWDYFDNKGTTNNTTGITEGKYHQGAFSPKFGLVYQIVKDQLSLFGNYMNGFQNNSPRSQPDGKIYSYKPSQANQWEGGLKVDLLQHKIKGTVSYYAIKVSDILRSDYPDRPAFTVQDGEQYSKGIEAQFTANPFIGFNIIVGYAYNDSKYQKVSQTLDGYRPTSAGPAHMANWWMNYRIPSGTLKNIGFGFGGNYAGENEIGVYQEHDYRLPSFTVLNASLSYDKRRYSITCKLDNLTDKRYWIGWGTTNPGMPRRASLNLAVKF